MRVDRKARKAKYLETALLELSESERYGLKMQEKQHRPRKESKLTLAQESIVKRAIECGDTKQAIREDRPEVSQQRVAQVEDQIAIKTRDIMDECGLTDHELINCYLKPALKAKETRHFPMPTKDDPTHIEEREAIAWNPRLRAADMAFQLRGSYPPRNSNLEIGVELSLADEVRKARARIMVRQSASESASNQEPISENE